jgi:hypothetical protein
VPIALLRYEHLGKTMRSRLNSIDWLQDRSNRTTLASGTLVLGDSSELSNDFLQTGAAPSISAGSHGSGVFLGGITVIHIA